MAKRTSNNRYGQRTSSRRGYEEDEFRRPLREDEFNARSSSKEKIFTSIYEDIDSDEWQSSHRNERSNSATGRNRSSRGGFGTTGNDRSRSAGRSGQSSRGRRSGVMIQKKEKKPFGGNLVLPKKEESDFTIVACVVLLSFIGLVMVTSSSYYYAYTTMGDSMYLFRRQLIYLVLGIFAMVAAMKFPIALMKKFSKVAYLASIVCSVLVLFVGIEVNGSTRWLGVGQLSFQPAELAKIGVALHMSYLVEEHQDDITDLKVFIRLLIVLGIPTLLVAYQNLSSGLIIAVIGIIIMFVGGARWKHFFMIAGPVAGLAALIIVLPMVIPIESFPEFMQGFLSEFFYRTERVQAWLDPFAYAQDEGYQTIQSLYAVGSGGFFGRGLGQSLQKLGYIPEAYNDIIFSIICEELGLFGAAIVVLLFGMFTWHGIKISLFAPNKYTALLSAGIVGQIAIQAIMNIAVNTNTIPATGVSLPFISYGGSSMLFLMASVGIVLNISGYTRKTSAS